MIKKYIYNAIIGLPANIFMLLLVVVNFIAYISQPGLSPFDEITGGHHLGGVAIFFLRLALPFYLLIVIVGICALLRSLYNILTGKKVQIVTLIITYCTLFSLLLVTYGTFFKSDMEVFKTKINWEKNIVLKSYGGEIICDRYIWRNDTIMYRNNEDYNIVDTLIIDTENESCYWTHSPELKYDIIFDHRYRFDESPKNMTLGPDDYMKKFEYIINSVNNKPLDQYYCDGSVYRKKFEDDSNLCFMVESGSEIGYVMFQKKNSVAIFSDSTSSIKTKSGFCYTYEIEGCLEKEKGLPLVKMVERCDGYQYTDFYDFEKKDILISVQTSERLAEGKYEEVKLYRSHEDVCMKEGYPIIEYVRIIESDTLDVGRCEYVRIITDTLEVGRYEMENGEYVKKTEGVEYIKR
jgi:hypothetical protein